MSELYEKGINGNYCIMEKEAEDYSVNILLYNQIKGIVPVTRRIEEDREKLYYDISSRETLKAALGHRIIKGEDVRRMLFCIKEMTDTLNDYLLNESDVYMESDHIYVDDDSMELSFMICPGHGGNFTKDLSKILRDIFSAVDNNDHEGVVMAYSLYQASLKEDYVFDDLLLALDHSLKDNYH